ncbi:MAG: DUF3037 domain-containing protein [Caldilineaceae bacterium]|nr:DUF3037 domain-containing protein [Caldilineaceae bacterium]
MPERPSKPPYTSYDYAVIRVIPSITRGECMNVGVILFCRTQRFLDAHVELDRARLAAIAPAHLDYDRVEAALALFPAIAQGAGPIGALPLADRFHWLTSPRSTIIQPSVVHCGRCTDPAAALTHLMDVMVR